MSTYIIPNGDLLAAARSFNLINAFAHGANCWQVMGSGIAKYVAEFTDIRQVDSLDERSPEDRLGKLTYAYDYKSGVHGFNLYTQFYPGPNARMPHIISAVESMLEVIHDLVEAKDDEVVYVGLPAIGCGIGGLNLVEVVKNVHALCATHYDDCKRRVIPVFYIMEGQRFATEIAALSAWGGVIPAFPNDLLYVVESEAEIIEMEGE